MLDQRLERVAVIGAAGKMGRGIALLLLQEMARLELSQTGGIGSGLFRLVLIDSDERGLARLWPTFRPQLTRYAEQNINALRQFYAHRADLVENRDMIQAFVEGAFSLVWRGSDLALARGTQLLFEAVVEEEKGKGELFRALKPLVATDGYFFTNTSSLPISVLEQAGGLEGRLIGFHFYNPPPLQKLVELIPSAQTPQPLVQLSQELGHRLGKTLVTSADRAGFIGNGHFAREICYAGDRVKALEKELGREMAIALLNRVTQLYLLRPMGIFELVQYVGPQTAARILAIMRKYLKDDTLQCPLLEGLKEFKLDSKAQEQLNKLAPAPPFGSWSTFSKSGQLPSLLEAHFQWLNAQQTLGAQEARRFLERSRAIAQQLLDEGVAASPEEVATVLKLGFAHLYSP